MLDSVGYAVITDARNPYVEHGPSLSRHRKQIVQNHMEIGNLFSEWFRTCDRFRRISLQEGIETILIIEFVGQ